MPNTLYKIQDLVIDESNAILTRNGKQINITGRAYALLIALVKASPNLLSHDEIMSEVWENRIVNDETIKQTVSRIRSILKDDCKNPLFIESIRGKGYRCAGPVKRITAEESDSRIIAKKPLSKYLISALLLMFIVTIPLLLYFNDFKNKTTKPPRIAVMPFLTLNEDGQDDYLAAGLTEELISALTQNDQLKILARTTTLAFKNTSKTAADIAKQLDVDVIVEGSIRRLDNRVRVYVQLIDGDTQEHLWSIEFDRPYTDIFNIRTEVSNRIASSLGIKASNFAHFPSPTENMDAYDDFLQGRANYEKYTAESFSAAIILFNRAIERDSDFIDAKAWLANSYAMKAGHKVQDQFASKAIIIAKEVIGIHPDHAFAHKALGKAYLKLGRNSEALQSFDKSLELKPSNLWTLASIASIYTQVGELAMASEFYKKMIEKYSNDHHNLSMVFSYYANRMLSLGFADSAKYALEKAIELDPSNLSVIFAKNNMLVRTGQIQSALLYMNEIIELHPDCTSCLLTVADNYRALGNWQTASSIYKKIFLDSGQTDSFSGYSYAELEFEQGNINEAKDVLERVKIKEQLFLTSNHHDFIHYALLGGIANLNQQYDVAFKWFKLAIAAGHMDLQWYETDQFLENFRKTSFYPQLVKLIKEKINIQREYVLTHRINQLLQTTTNGPLNNDNNVG